MKIEVNFSRFCDEFQRAGRADQFSYEAKKALFEYLDDEDVELGVIALCCEFTESAADEVRDEHGLDSDMTEQDVFDWLCDQTLAIAPENGSFLYRAF